ncbi:hypothetical protein BKA70DRAFT_1214075 [Coprinopsis sp. MPI-PUGE-AT-0042]|nr:hypothetical protein BKA70DRAFT_1214075 [Coprinopsis sp. MPI-PUGE-AT-0042]
MKNAHADSFDLSVFQARPGRVREGPPDSGYELEISRATASALDCLWCLVPVGLDNASVRLKSSVQRRGGCIIGSYSIYKAVPREKPKSGRPTTGQYWENLQSVPTRQKVVSTSVHQLEQSAKTARSGTVLGQECDLAKVLKDLFGYKSRVSRRGEREKRTPQAAVPALSAQIDCRTSTMGLAKTKDVYSTQRGGGGGYSQEKDAERSFEFELKPFESSRAAGGVLNIICRPSLYVTLTQTSFF